MAQREGAVYLYLFIGTFVLFVGVLVLFFVENSKTNELRANLSKEEGLKKSAEGLAAKANMDLRKLRGLVGGPTAMDTWPGDEVYDQKFKEAEAFINKIRKLGPPISDLTTATTLRDMGEAYTYFQDFITKILDSNKKLLEDQKRAQEDQIAARKQTQEEGKKNTEVVSGLKTTLQETEQKYEKRVSDVTKEGDRIARELANVQNEASTKEINWRRQEQVYKNMIASLQTRLDKLTEEQRKVRTIEDVEPDGEILDVISGSQIGWVNIGRKQHLRPGLDFQVFQMIKGGKRQYKGRLEIQQVEDSTSRFRILDTKDDLNPIAKGDFITSPFYDPKAVPVFVFAGEGMESGNVTRDTLEKKIKSYGAEIREEVDLRTTFLIALKGYENTPLFKTARELGVPVLRERDILEYMGF